MISADHRAKPIDASSQAIDKIVEFLLPMLVPKLLWLTIMRNNNFSFEKFKEISLKIQSFHYLINKKILDAYQVKAINEYYMIFE